MTGACMQIFPGLSNCKVSTQAAYLEMLSCQRLISDPDSTTFSPDKAQSSKLICCEGFDITKCSIVIQVYTMIYL